MYIPYIYLEREIMFGAQRHIYSLGKHPMLFEEEKVEDACII